MFRKVIIALLVCNALAAIAQPMETDIWLVRSVPYNGNDILVNEPAYSDQNITGFNPYENQPSFTPDGKFLLYTAIGADGQADIYRYDLQSGITTQLTHTPESEYSPIVTPDGKHISVVRVEMDSTQRLWQFDLNGRNPEVLFPEQKQIGYYAWAGTDEAICFLVTEPFTLVRLRKGKPTEHVADSVGRCIQKIPGDNAISYVVKHYNWNLIMRYDLEKGISAPLFGCNKDAEDYVWLGSMLLQPVGNEIRQASPYDDFAYWHTLHRLPSDKAKDLYRIAISPDGKMIAVVNRNKAN